MDPIIETRALTHTYVDGQNEEMIALDGISLSIMPGEFVAIIGTNGSGKSTLARHFNALLTPTKGTCLVGGLDTSVEENLWQVRQTVGMVFQNPDNQIVAAVVEEDVAFGLENIGVPGPEIRPRVEKALTDVGMLSYAKHAPHRLSGGQKQRCVCARALVHTPKLILADEPTGALDSHSAQLLLASLQNIHTQLGATILMVTHDAFAASYAQRILVLRDGAIFTELRRGAESRKQFFDKILNVLTMMGGGQSNDD